MGNNGSGYANSESPPLGSSSSEQGAAQTGHGDDRSAPIVENLPAEFTAKYQAVSKIGSGSFGDVYRVRDKKTKAVYAAKMVDQHRHNPHSEVGARKHCH